jgi:hypothetical protein
VTSKLLRLKINILQKKKKRRKKPAYKNMALRRILEGIWGKIGKRIPVANLGTLLPSPSDRFASKLPIYTEDKIIRYRTFKYTQ